MSDFLRLDPSELRRRLGERDVEIAMIWAQTTDRVIGDGEDMPWYLPEDLKHFKDSTVGYPVVMGRTSWEALEDGYRPLPGRENWVVTSNAAYSAPGGHVCSSLPDAICEAADWIAPRSQGESAGRELTNTVWILGGGTVYEQCMDVAHRIVVTDIEMTAPERFQVVAPAIPDTEFELDASEWFESAKGHPVGGSGPLRYRFCTWTRRP